MPGDVTLLKTTLTLANAIGVPCPQQQQHTLPHSHSDARQWGAGPGTWLAVLVDCVVVSSKPVCLLASLTPI